MTFPIFDETKLPITIGGEKAEFSSLAFVKPEMWSPLGKVLGKTKEVQQINDSLDKIKIALDNHYKAILDKDGYVTADKLRDTYLGKIVRKHTALSLYDIKVEQKRNLVGKTIRDTTLAKYLATRKRVADFMVYKYKKEDIPIRDINFQFVIELLKLKIHSPQSLQQSIEQTFKSTLSLIPKFPNLGIMGMTELLTSIELLGGIDEAGKNPSKIAFANVFEQSFGFSFNDIYDCQRELFKRKPYNLTKTLDALKAVLVKEYNKRKNPKNKDVKR